MSSSNKCFLFFSILLIFSVSTAFAITSPKNPLNVSAGISSEASLTVEKRSYLKGETVVVQGEGFRRFEEIELKVEQFDNLLGQNVLRGTWIVFADRKGSFVSEWNVPSEGVFSIKGSGSLSGREAEPVFFSCVTPIVVSGNPNCATLNASSNSAFAHITSNFGFKIDPPASGTWTFTNAAGRTLTGSAPPSGSSRVTVSLQNSKTFNWSATRSIKAVIVKGGPNANVYAYAPSAFSDTTLTTVGNGPAISHIEFCFDNTAPSAARVSVGGRVTDAYGNGLARTTLTIMNSTNAETRTVLSNSFGFYRFDDLEVGNLYIVMASNRRYTFESNAQTLSLTDAVDDLNFRAVE